MMSRVATAVIVLALVVALGFLVFPNVVMQPYTAQNAGLLAVALTMFRYQHLVEVLCGVTALLAVFQSYREHSRRKWAIAAAAGVLLCGALSTINLYEKLFHPIGRPAFQPIGETKLDPDEHLLAVNLSESRAYPIRTISYHHVVNDEIGGIPIAVTY